MRLRTTLETILVQEQTIEALEAELKALRARNNILRTWATQAKSENKALRAQLDLYKPMYRDVMATLLELSSKY